MDRIEFDAMTAIGIDVLKQFNPEAKDQPGIRQGRVDLEVEYGRKIY